MVKILAFCAENHKFSFMEIYGYILTVYVAINDHLIGDLSIFYRYFHGYCSQEIRNVIPVPLRHVRTTRS